MTQLRLRQYRHSPGSYTRWRRLPVVDDVTKENTTDQQHGTGVWQQRFLALLVIAVASHLQGHADKSEEDRSNQGFGTCVGNACGACSHSTLRDAVQDFSGN